MNSRGNRFIQGLSAALMLLVAAPTFADVAGRWSGAMATPNGEMAIAFEFAEEGGMVTGTSTGPDGATIDIKNGKLEGEKISFSVDVDMQGTPASFPHTGIIKGDVIEMTIDAFGMPMTFNVTRAEP